MKLVDPKGLAPWWPCASTLPADNGLLRVFELRIRKWWEVLVMLQSSLPAFVFDTGFTDRQPEHLPNW
jgi:hypothetical protein